MNHLINLSDAILMQEKLHQLGIALDVQTGHLFYDCLFKPKPYTFQLMFVRHGETYGNCGQSTISGEINHELVQLGIKDKQKRIYQGFVDTEINQLTQVGQEQAIQVANLLEEKFLNQHWQPDFIFHSPLTRAKDTGFPFVEKHRLQDRYIVHPDIREMSFGAWENRRICDMKSNDPCHLFYQQQHALVKKPGVNAQGVYQDAECFCEVLLRAHEVLQAFEQEYPGKRIVLFSHSMFGAACCILFGLGQEHDQLPCLAFDGKRENGLSYALPHATPVALNF